jgi:hypothetical protein
MAITLLLLFCILFSTGIFLEHRTKLNNFKKNEMEVFLKTITERKITLDLIISDKQEFYTHPLMISRNFVHKIFSSTDGEYFLYMRCGNGNPQIQVISKERATGSA